MSIRVLPEFGTSRLADLSHADVQRFADRLVEEGLSPSYVQTTLLPLGAVFRRAISRGDLAVNPCADLELPAVRGRRERFASPEEAEALIAALPQEDRPIWATAMYAGLRLGELRALRAEDVDLDGGVIRVERGWDPVEGEIKLKSHAGRRKVPVVPLLRSFVADDLARTGRASTDLIFGRTAADPFTSNRLQFRADEAWGAANDRTRERAEAEGDEAQGAPTHHASCLPSYVRLADDRCGGQRESPLDLYGSRKHLDHPGPLWTPDARLRGRGGAVPWRIPLQPEKHRSSQEGRGAAALR